MKTFPAGFTAEKNKKTGALAIWILRLTADDVDYWISDGVYTIPPGGPGWPAPADVTTLSWVAAWGAIRESIGGGIGEILIADFTVSMITDQATGTNIEYLATTHELERDVCQLYLWYDGLDALTDPPQLMFSGNVRDLDIPDETGVGLSIEDETAKLEQYLGTKITSEVYPLCDPDVVGKMIPIVYGPVPQLPALCVDSGWVTSIVAEIAANDTTLAVSEIPAYPLINRNITIDDEQLRIVNQANNYAVYNWAAAQNSASATASSTYNSGSLAQNAINGDRVGYNPNAGGYWTALVGLPQWLQVNFPAARSINEVSVFSVQDNYANPVVPDESMAGTLWVLAAFQVQTWNGSAWVTQSTVAGNNKIWKRVTFAPVTTDRIRIYVTAASSDSYARIVEVEAWLNTTPLSYGKTLTVLRGQGGSAKVLHTKGSVVIEKKSTPLVYLCADHALDAIGSVMARVRGVNVDISADCTKYLGTALNQLAAYPGKAAITIPDFARVSQRISLELANTLAVSQGSHTHATVASTVVIKPNTTTNVYGGTSANNYNSTYAQRCWDGDASTYMDGIMQSDHAQTTPYYNFDGSYSMNMVCFNYTTVNNVANCLRIRVGVILETNADYGGHPTTIFLFLKGVPVLVQPLNFVNGKQTYYTGWYTFTNPADLYSNLNSWAGVSLQRVTGYKLYELWFEIETGAPTPYSGATGVGLTGALGLSGNSVADIMIGDAVLVDCTRSSCTLPIDVLTDALTRGAAGHDSNLFTESECRHGVSDLSTATNVSAGALTGYAGAIQFAAGAVDKISYKGNFTTVVGQAYCLSVVVKMADLSAPRISNGNSGTSATDVVGIIGGAYPAAAGVVALGGDLYRCSWSMTASAASAANGCLQLAGNSNKALTITAVQINPGTVPDAYIATTTTAAVDRAIVTQVGTLPPHFKLVGAITEYKRLLEWLDSLAWQCGCYFRRIAGVSKLIVRSAQLTSLKDIPACCLDNEGKKRIKRKKAPLSDVVNTINLLYGRDWSSSNKQAESYTRNAPGTDPVSIKNYGIRERPDQFMFDFVVDSQMAADLVSLFLALHGPRPWRVSFFTFLDHCELEFADVVTLNFANFLVGQIVEAALIPGDTDNMDSIEFTILSPTLPQAPLNAIITATGNPMITNDRRFIIYAGYP